MNAWAAAAVGPALVAMFVLVVALAVMAGWTVVRLRRLEGHYRLLTTGTDGGNLQAVLEDHVGQLQAETAKVQALDEAVRAMEEANCGHIQHLGFLRYNPFRETGGDQSFVLALADGNGDGTVISSLHSRDVTRVYAKPLRAWQSAYPLTEEELQAIAKART